MKFPFFYQIHVHDTNVHESEKKKSLVFELSVHILHFLLNLEASMILSLFLVAKIFFQIHVPGYMDLKKTANFVYPGTWMLKKTAICDFAFFRSLRRY